MLILVIITGLLLLFLGYGLYLYKYKREKFLEQKSIIEFVSIFVFIFFAVLTIYQTTESIKSSQEDSLVLIKKMDNIISSANNAKNVLDSVSFRLGRLPNELDKFSNSIRNLDAVVQTQQNKFLENIQSLKENVGGLSSSIGEYKNYIDNYSIQLKKIVAQTDSQLVIWKNQQELVKRDYDRRPVLSFVINDKNETDSSITINELILKNDGNIIAQIYGIVLYVNKDYILPKTNLAEWKLIKQSGNYNLFQFRQETIQSFPISSHSRRSIKIEISNYSKIKFPKEILYEIFYESRFEDGNISGILNLF